MARRSGFLKKMSKAVLERRQAPVGTASRTRLNNVNKQKQRAVCLLALPAAAVGLRRQQATHAIA